MQHIWFWPVWPTWPHGPANPTWVTKLSDSGGTVTKLDLAWGHIWGHIELLQEVLSMSRMHSIEVDIPYASPAPIQLGMEEEEEALV